MTATLSPLDLATMNPATVVPMRFLYEDSLVRETSLPYWQGEAHAVLSGTLPDVRRLLGARDVPYDNERGPERLLSAAIWVSTRASRCRKARWEGLPPERIGDDAFSAHSETEGLQRNRYGMQSYLIEAHDALSVRDVAAWRAGGGATVSKDVSRVPLAFLLHANVSPATEARLAAQGYTAAEYLIDQAADTVLAIARMYAAATVNPTEDWHRAGYEATLLAQEAKRVLAQGVRHTLAATKVAA